MHYADLFGRLALGRYALNSALVAVDHDRRARSPSTAPAGYAFAKMRFRGRDGTFRALAAGLAIPAQVAMLPLFLLIKSLGLVNNYGGVIIPGLASIFGIFLVRQYALAIPDDLLDAARIDGGERVARLPLDRAADDSPGAGHALAVDLPRHVERFHVAAHRPERRPAVHAAGRAGGTRRRACAGRRADDGGRVMTVLPVLILFLMLQRYYVRGRHGREREMMALRRAA